MAQVFLKVFYDFLQEIDMLSMAERGQLLTAMLCYARGEGVPEGLLTGNAGVLFPVCRLRIDRDGEAYAHRVQTNRENGKKGGRPPKAGRDALPENPAGYSETEKTQDKEKDKEKENEKEKDEGEGEDGDARACARGGAPSLEAVKDFCRESGLKVDAERFWNYYQAVGWRVGALPLTDWRAKLRQWNAEDGDGGRFGYAVRAAPVNPALNYEQRDYTEEDYKDIFWDFGKGD